MTDYRSVIERMQYRSVIERIQNRSVIERIQNSSVIERMPYRSVIERVQEIYTAGIGRLATNNASPPNRAAVCWEHTLHSMPVSIYLIFVMARMHGVYGAVHVTAMHDR